MHRFGCQRRRTRLGDAVAAAYAELRSPPGTKQRGDLTIIKDSSMYRSLMVALTVLLLATAVPLLSACHTTAGAGEDISATGHAITNSADRHTP
jgi:predicted small secreted protein